MTTTLMTVKEVRKAIRQAKIILIVPRFGLVEKQIKITKAEALELISGIENTDTPSEMGMFGEGFGDIESDGTLYLG